MNLAAIYATLQLFVIASKFFRFHIYYVLSIQKHTGAIISNECSKLECAFFLITLVQRHLVTLTFYVIIKLSIAVRCTVCILEYFAIRKLSTFDTCGLAFIP